MSVTFAIESLPTGVFTIECDDEQGETVEVARADSYEAILVHREAHIATCEECAHYGCYAKAEMDVSDELDVNLANTNARMMLSILGIEDGGDLCGMVPADQFLGAVMLAMAEERDDSGVPAVEVTPGQSGATMIDCGLPEGYFASRFAALYDLAAEANRLGRAVVFS